MKSATSINILFEFVHNLCSIDRFSTVARINLRTFGIGQFVSATISIGLISCTTIISHNHHLSQPSSSLAIINTTGEPKMTTKWKWYTIIVSISILWIFLDPRRVANNEFTLDVSSNQGNIYSTFLANIRDNIRDPKLKYGGMNIPVIGAPTNTFLRINLQLSAGNTVSVAVRRMDLYVVAYMSKNDKQKVWTYYFSKVISPADLDKVFKETKGTKNRKIITEYDETYHGLETAAKVNRKNAGLGIDKLKTYMEGVYEKARQVTSESRFILLTVQMVAEAARSRYIENAVLHDYPSAFTPDDKVIITERNWERISEAIKGSKNGVFSPPITLDAKAPYVTTTWTVSNANELNMGILKYLGK